MFPFKTSIQFDRSGDQALYLQLSDQIIQLIKSHTLEPESKLPSSRSLALQLGVHRNTVVACYDELLLQGWIESIPKKGTYVKGSLPLLKQQKLGGRMNRGTKERSGFAFNTNRSIAPRKPVEKQKGFMYLNDGIPDVRLTPIDQIARTYRRICSRSTAVSYTHLTLPTTSRV